MRRNVVLAHVDRTCIGGTTLMDFHPSWRLNNLGRCPHDRDQGALLSPLATARVVDRTAANDWCKASASRLVVVLKGPWNFLEAYQVQSYCTVLRGVYLKGVVFVTGLLCFPRALALLGDQCRFHIDTPCGRTGRSRVALRTVPVDIIAAKEFVLRPTWWASRGVRKQHPLGNGNSIL